MNSPVYGTCTWAHRHTHTRLSNHPLNPFSHVFWNISPTSIYFKNQRFCANLFGRAKASLFTIEEIWNKQPCPQPPLAPSNQLPVEHKYAQWKTNKQTKKKTQTMEPSLRGKQQKLLFAKAQSWRDFFFFLNEQRHTAPWEQRGSQEPLGHGATSLTSLAKGKSCFNCPSLFFHSSL